MRTPLLLALTCLAADAFGYAPMPPRDYQPAFDAVGHFPTTTARAARPPGARIAATDDGALAIDADSGQLVLADRDDKRVAALDVGANPGLLVYDRDAHRAYVADRARDRILAIDVRATSVAIAATITTPAEPYGLALSPDGKTLLVTTIADRALVAYDTATARELWRTSIAAEPRGIAISPDGKHAIVAHVTTGDVELVDLATHAIKKRALRHDLSPHCTKDRDEKSSVQCADPDATSFARGAFAAQFLGNDVAAIAFQRETPVPRPAFAASQAYGGSAIPITRHLALLALDGTQGIAQINAAEPRALAFDATRDLLYVAGMGNDTLVAIEHASRGARAGDVVRIADKDACGVDGLAVAPNGDVLAWCAFTRSIARLHLTEAPPKSIPRYTLELSRGPAIAPTHFTDEQHAGFVRFHQISPQIARFERAACATCHVDGRSDGLAWAIEKQTLRTPVLAGRVANTAPYKWTGRDATLDASIVSTIDRLGGYAGSHRDYYNLHGPDPLVAYLETLPPVRTPTLAVDAVARGKSLFDSLGCANCHAGAETTDHARHSFEGSPLELDTPSLHGLTAAPRYLHDASAATLDDVLAERGSIRGMIARPLSKAERADLAAFLDSL